MVIEIRVDTQPNDPNPRPRTWGIGAIKSTLSGVTKASTEAVPRMNMSAMIGAEIQTERLMLREGARHSPARMAMSSKPDSAPTASLLQTLRLRLLISGRLSENGW